MRARRRAASVVNRSFIADQTPLNSSDENPRCDSMSRVIEYATNRAACQSDGSKYCACPDSASDSYHSTAIGDQSGLAAGCSTGPPATTVSIATSGLLRRRRSVDLFGTGPGIRNTTLHKHEPAERSYDRRPPNPYRHSLA